MNNPTERERLQGLIDRLQDKADSAQHNALNVNRNGYLSSIKLFSKLHGQVEGFREAADIVRSALDGLEPEVGQSKPVPDGAIELMRALPEWKDSGEHVGTVVFALANYLQEHMPHIVARAVRSQKK